MYVRNTGEMSKNMYYKNKYIDRQTHTQTKTQTNM